MIIRENQRFDYYQVTHTLEVYLQQFLSSIQRVVETVNNNIKIIKL